MYSVILKTPGKYLFVYNLYSYIHRNVYALHLFMYVSRFMWCTYPLKYICYAFGTTLCRRENRFIHLDCTFFVYSVFFFIFYETFGFHNFFPAISNEPSSEYDS